MSILLGVNIDHIATIRQARGTKYPELAHAAAACEQAGADAITIHLREDRRHIQDRDVYLLRETLQTRMNLEMAVTKEMIEIACDVKPADVCLVPEKREELTTEGGLDVLGNEERITQAVEQLGEAGIRVSLFIDPVETQIEAASRTGAPVVEIHTGSYAEVSHTDELEIELGKIIHAAKFADDAGLIVNGGHGLHYHNTESIAAISQMNELNIGHAIVARALFTGLPEAVREMKRLMRAVR